MVLRGSPLSGKHISQNAPATSGHIPAGSLLRPIHPAASPGATAANSDTKNGLTRRTAEPEGPEAKRTPAHESRGPHSAGTDIHFRPPDSVSLDPASAPAARSLVKPSLSLHIARKHPDTLVTPSLRHAWNANGCRTAKAERSHSGAVALTSIIPSPMRRTAPASSSPARNPGLQPPRPPGNASPPLTALAAPGLPPNALISRHAAGASPGGIHFAHLAAVALPPASAAAIAMAASTHALGGPGFGRRDDGSRESSSIHSANGERRAGRAWSRTFFTFTFTSLSPSLPQVGPDGFSQK